MEYNLFKKSKKKHFPHLIIPSKFKCNSQGLMLDLKI